MFELQQILLLVILAIFAFFSIKQDLLERKVSNHITISLFIFSFVYFVFNSAHLVWIDYIMIFSGFLLSFIIYYKGVWGAADGKIFLAIMLLLVGFSESGMFLRWVMNLVFFYSIVISILSVLGTDKKLKKKIFFKLDHLDSAILILLIFMLIHFLGMVYTVDSSSLFAMITFFVVLFAFLYKMKKFLRKQFKHVFVDVKLMIFALIFMWNFLYFGMFWFVLTFCLVFCLKTFISFVSKLSSYIRADHGGNYDSPFSLYLFLTAIFTIITNKSFVEILVLFFY
jgi:Flp pilus assembly protein protease CpaA